ncbi:solute carrier family 22 member 15-like [Nematostella vectensis]|uniref:solute carrier family 22 member 15-like n=1 Tax=Nematostella vectensis TaxID=45351 RepID=UPI0020771E7C|nr:solute carrier family 22 member 15-like [Nematostella vectensis]
MHPPYLPKMPEKQMELGELSPYRAGKENSMTLTSDQAVEKAGSFGWYQLRVFAVISYAKIFCSCVLMVMTFSTAEPHWQCVANSSCNFTGTFKPGDANYEKRCMMARDQWEFAIDAGFDSIVTEWDLVCSKSMYATIANSITFILWIFGAMAGSIIGDKFGRKIVVFPCVIFASLCGLASAFANKYWVFALFRALLGAGIGGYSICSFVLVMEYIGIRHRSIVGFCVFYPWILALFMLALLGYLIPSWRTLSIITSAPGLLFFVFWWFTPDSLRWYLVKGKFDDAKKVLVDVAKGCGNNYTKQDFEFEEEHTFNIEHERLGDIRDLFHSRSMAHRTLVSWYCWLVSGLVYYGISLSSTTIGGDMYLNFFLSALFEGIGMAIGIPLLDRFGRKKTIAASMCVAALAAIVAALLSQYDDGSQAMLVGKIISAMVIAKFFVTIAFDGVYVYSSELFPTVVRNTAMGTSTSAARIGSFAAPFTVYSQKVHPMMPFGIMALNALICGILCMTLPETKDKPLPDTVKQTEESPCEYAFEADQNGCIVEEKLLQPFPTQYVSAA